MQYKIVGGNLPAVLCYLEAGENVFCQKGAMIWMDEGIEMQTEGGGIGKMFSRALSGEAMFRNRYVAHRAGEIAFGVNSPGEIQAVQINKDHGIIAQKGSFLASEADIDMSIFFQKKVGAGFFGGEGFIMQKITGNGTVLFEIDGSSVTYDLGPGEKKIIDTGYLVMMDDTCTMDIVQVKGAMNVVFGGEGLFNTVVTGPGRIVLQTMPFSRTVEAIRALSSSS